MYVRSPNETEKKINGTFHILKAKYMPKYLPRRQHPSLAEFTDGGPNPSRIYIYNLYICLISHM